MPYKMALCGAHGTGKTTLLAELDRRLRGKGVTCSVVPEVPRIVCATVGDPQFFRRGQNVLERQISLLVGQAVLESVHSRDNIVTLCDRTMLDHWAYTKFLFKDRLIENRLLAVLEHFVQVYCSTYAAHFYVPIEFPPEDDGTRESDPEFQEGIDGEIRRLLDEFGLKYTAVRGSVMERARLVLESQEITELCQGGSVQ